MQNPESGTLGPLSSCFGKAFIAAVRAYQYAVSPLLPPACRFYPSCSEYAAQAIAAHGPGWGLWLALRRLLRCHPWHPGGLDPVPRQRPALLRRRTLAAGRKRGARAAASSPSRLTAPSASAIAERGSIPS